VRELLIGVLVALVYLAIMAAAGTADMIDEQVYRESWYEQNGVTQWSEP